MVNKILLTFILADFLFLLSGGLLIAFSLVTERESTATPSVTNVARNLILVECPLRAGIANAVMVFITFLLSIPAMIMPATRSWLKVHGYMVVVCALFTLVIGLDIWFDTLKSRANLLSVWTAQPAATQSLLQQELNCCGYLNSTSPLFVTDSTCTSAFVAASKLGCVGPFSTYANGFLDLVFTAAFGIVGIDTFLVLAVAMLLKEREEKERYRHIDLKNGVGSI